jgi:hypothetical protein
MPLVEPIAIVFGRRCHVCEKIGSRIVPVVTYRDGHEPILTGARCEYCQTMFHHPFFMMSLDVIGEIMENDLDGEEKFIPEDGQCPVHNISDYDELTGTATVVSGKYEFCAICFRLLKAPA